MIKLIVGLGNPGKNYQEHRHNAGFWFVESLATLNSSKFTSQSKFVGETCSFSLSSTKIFLLKPQTYMNNSGGSIKSFLNYYDISQEEFYSDLTNIVTRAKQDGVIPKNKGISYETLKKYNIELK